MQVSALGCSASLPRPEVLVEDIAAELSDWVARL